ncbi:uncharacterized protein At4g02000-like [Syzygium oleosum]|uniref:uncharacterized protein At4g02000-like n=1 Tax=Syzygium oleosum TaxID=219896 RepID=UPI0024BB2B8F|nr:uncharacterized protein At4g02000-like [Syzygium oleosum]
MKKSWKTDQLECKLIEPGLFSFSFTSIEEKNRVLNSGPWSFSSKLLVLQQGDPDTPDHCYEFTHCAFWVQLAGIPRGKLSEDTVKEIARKIGEVVEVKLDSRGGGPSRSCKVRVLVNLSNPLKTGTIVDLKHKKIWVDFRYERLPHFCYSCWRIGHYATYCKEVPFAESGPIVNARSKFGQWLRAEVQEPSPFWKIFYSTYSPSTEENEVIPETQRELIPREPELTTSKGKTIIGLIEDSPQKERLTEGTQPDCLNGKGQLGSIIQDTQLIRSGSAMKDGQSKKPRREKISMKAFKKVATTRKQKKIDPQGVCEILYPSINEGTLLDAPIKLVDGRNDWALVASPNKPPGII